MASKSVWLTALLPRRACSPIGLACACDPASHPLYAERGHRLGQRNSQFVSVGLREVEDQSTHMPFPDFTPTLPVLLRRLAAEHGARELIVTEARRISYAQAESESAELARALLASGVGKGTRVGILFPNGPDWVAAFFAATRIGAARRADQHVLPGARARLGAAPRRRAGAALLRAHAAPRFSASGSSARRRAWPSARASRSTSPSCPIFARCGCGVARPATGRWTDRAASRTRCAPRRRSTRASSSASRRASRPRTRPW